MLSKISVKVLDQCDLATVLRWRNTITVRQSMFNSAIISIEEHREWFNKLCNDEDRIGVVVCENKKKIGFVQFKNINQARDIEWGFYKNPSSAKGTGTKVAIAAINYLHSNYNFQNLWGRVKSTNKPSINFHLSLGFNIESISKPDLSDGKENETVLNFLLKREIWINNDKK